MCIRMPGPFCPYGFRPTDVGPDRPTWSMPVEIYLSHKEKTGARDARRLLNRSRAKVRVVGVGSTWFHVVLKEQGSPAPSSGPGTAEDHRHWILARSSVSRPEKISYYLAHRPAGTTLDKLIHITGGRCMMGDGGMPPECEAGVRSGRLRTTRAQPLETAQRSARTPLQ
ncbi:hypothetical protein SSPO_001250 [Streptomyces antimycoticus]|uniref:Uncharacterized protein n=1 Tax=Streptomyces antimycoticus TaxID=68175 RepID=A0A499UU58_9ACTN|nr:hypothetical protein SSPO_001250 [Streptomyces antimycoticus]